MSEGYTMRIFNVKGGMEPPKEDTVKVDDPAEAAHMAWVQSFQVQKTRSEMTDEEFAAAMKAIEEKGGDKAAIPDVHTRLRRAITVPASVLDVDRPAAEEIAAPVAVEVQPAIPYDGTEGPFEMPAHPPIMPSRVDLPA